MNCFSIAIPINFEDRLCAGRRRSRQGVKKAIEWELKKRKVSLVKTECEFTRKLNEGHPFRLFCVKYTTYYQ